MKMKPRRASPLPANLALAALSLLVAACGGTDTSTVGTEPAAENISPDVAAAELAAAQEAATSEDVAPDIALKVNAAAVRDDALTDRFIVKYKSATPEGKQPSAVRSKLSRLNAAFPARANHVRRMGIGSDVVTTEHKLNARDAKAFMRALASDPNVEYVEPDLEMSITAAPNDPGYARQWYLASNATNPTSNAVGIRAESAWEIAKGSGAVIGIVDTGSTNHADYSPNLLPGYQFTGIDRLPGGLDPGFPGGQCAIPWHGTHVSGIAAALTNNGVGIAGVAPAAKVLPVKTLGACGNGATSDVADGITWAAGGTVPDAPVNPHPATVINLSLAQWNSCSKTMQSAIDYATSKGAVTVVAAGNNNRDVSEYQPANCRNVIAVGGTNGGASYSVSNFGTGIDIAAPAADIWSTYNSGKATPAADDYGYMSGTSMATPMVSGAIALIQSVLPRPLSVAETRALLQQNSQPFPKPPDRLLGPGIVDAGKAVAAAKAGDIPVAADFECKQPIDFLQIKCTDQSTARGAAAIKSVKWSLGADSDWGNNVVKVPPFNPTANLAYPGTHIINLVVTGTDGKESSYSRAIQVLPPSKITNVSSGVPVAFTDAGGMRYYKIPLPSGVKSVTATVKFASPTAGTFLYMRDSPTSLWPQCHANGLGTVTCTVSNPPAGDYYAITSMNGSADYTGTMTMTYE